MPIIEQREGRRAITASVAVHLLLIGSLFVSLNWNRKPPTPVQVELWAGPPVVVPEPVTPPPPPAVKAPPPVKAAAKVAPPAPTKADIALKEAKPPKPDPKELARQAAEKKLAQEKLEQERQRERQRLAQEKVAQEKQRRQDQLDRLRQAELARLAAAQNAPPQQDGRDVATKAGVARGAEIGAKTGVDPDYATLIQSRIKARIQYADRTSDNPEAVVSVEQLPTGEIVAVQLVKPSGVPAWDAAVVRAIRASSPLPKRNDGTVARVLELSFRPKETP